jgi:starch synthase (maltosyl-transferring)
MVHLDLPAFGRSIGEIYPAHDLITDSVWTWGTDNYVRLDPFNEPVHILHVGA